MWTVGVEWENSSRGVAGFHAFDLQVIKPPKEKKERNLQVACWQPFKIHFPPP